jgi:hypothetical protein
MTSSEGLSYILRTLLSTSFSIFTEELEISTYRESVSISAEISSLPDDPPCLELVIREKAPALYRPFGERTES